MERRKDKPQILIFRKKLRRSIKVIEDDTISLPFCQDLYDPVLRTINNGSGLIRKRNSQTSRMSAFEQSIEMGSEGRSTSHQGLST